MFTGKRCEGFKGLNVWAFLSGRLWGQFCGICNWKSRFLTLIRLSVAFQKYNADYDLSAKEGADTLAFVSLLEEKLLPAVVSPER